jgi:hypothetical protein
MIVADKAKEGQWTFTSLKPTHIHIKNGEIQQLFAKVGLMNYKVPSSAGNASGEKWGVCRE